MGILHNIIAFSRFVELTTVNRWLTASAMGFFYFTDTFSYPFGLIQFLRGFLGIMLVLYYVMAVNDCFDVEDDKIKSKLGDKKLVVSVEISVEQALLLSFAMLLIGLLISLSVSLAFFLVVMSIALLSTLYSVPPIRFKQRFPISTLGEFAGSLLLFLSGFSILGFVDTRAIVVSVIFSLTTMYWRFIHETLFYEVDLKTGKTTFAVVYGTDATKTLANVCLLFVVIECLTLFGLGWFSVRFSIFLSLYLFFALGYWYRFVNYIPTIMRNIIGPTWGVIFVPIAVVFWML